MTTHAEIREAVAPFIENVLESFAWIVKEELESAARHNGLDSAANQALYQVAATVACVDYAWIVKEALNQARA